MVEDWYAKGIEHYAIGASDQEVAKELGVSMPTFKKKYSTDADFQRMVDTGRGYSMAWWMKEGRVNLQNKQFSYTGWFQNMKNRYGWADKSEVADTISKPVQALSTEDLNDEIEALLTRIGK